MLIYFKMSEYRHFFYKMFLLVSFQLFYRRYREASFKKKVGIKKENLPLMKLDEKRGCQTLWNLEQINKKYQGRHWENKKSVD